MSENEQELGLLSESEEFDEDEIGDYLDTGCSPAERPRGVNEWGTTEHESHRHEPLSRRLARETAETQRRDEEDDDTVGSDGEPVGDQVGSVRSGRLLAWDDDVTGATRAHDDGSDYRARDVGVDGAAASAEESAVRIVDSDSEGPPLTYSLGPSPAAPSRWGDAWPALRDTVCVPRRTPAIESTEVWAISKRLTAF